METHLLILKSHEYISCIMLHQWLGWLMKAGEQGEKVVDASFWNPSYIFNAMQNYKSGPNIQKVECYCVPCKGVCVECAFSLFYSGVLKEFVVALKNFRAWLLTVTWGFWLAFGNICHSSGAVRFCLSIWLFISLDHPKHLIVLPSWRSAKMWCISYNEMIVTVIAFPNLWFRKDRSKCWIHKQLCWCSYSISFNMLGKIPLCVSWLEWYCS